VSFLKRIMPIICPCPAFHICHAITWTMSVAGREDLRIIQQLKGDAATRQKLSETQCSRLSDRQKASEAKIQELRSQLTKLSMEQHREQESRAHIVSEMASTIQVWWLL